MTERCVLRLVGDSGHPALELVELAPGLDLQRDVLAHMDFAPLISPHLRPMDPALFDTAPLGLRQRLLATPLARRLELDAEHRLLFINFEGLHVQHEDEVADIESQVTRLLEPLTTRGERVAVVVNYDRFELAPHLSEPYSAMVARLTERHYSRVTRYGSGGFIKAKLERR